MHTYIHITTHICTYKKLESHYEFPKENTGSVVANPTKGGNLISRIIVL